MIENEVQYDLSKRSAEGFEERLKWLKENPGARDHIDPILAKAEEDGLQSMIDELTEDIREYETTKQGSAVITMFALVHSVPTDYFKARKGRASTQLAKLVSSGEERIESYEYNHFANTDLGQVPEIPSDSVREELNMMQIPISLERLDRLKEAEPALYFHFEEMFQNGSYTSRERELIRKLLDLGRWQMEAACSWFEYDLLRVPHEKAQLEDVIENWDQIQLVERPAITIEAIEKRRSDLEAEAIQKEAIVKRAKEEGCFWSIVPLLEYFNLPEEERAGKSCYPLLPFFMQRAYEEIQNSRQPIPGWVARLIESIKRFRFAISGKGGEIEIERYDPRESDKE